MEWCTFTQPSVLITFLRHVPSTRIVCSAKINICNGDGGGEDIVLADVTIILEQQLRALLRGNCGGDDKGCCVVHCGGCG